MLNNDDLDGSAFIEGLLEDALYFLFRGEGSKRKFEKWEMIEESSGIWVTRLQDNRMDKDGDGDGEDEDIDPEVSDDEDHNREIIIARQIEEALENLKAKALKDAVTRVDEYDTGEDSEADDYEMEDLDPGYSWEANIADVVWENDESDEENVYKDSKDAQRPTRHFLDDSLFVSKLWN